MGQEEVRLILSKKQEWLLAKEIANELGLSIGTIFRSLSILHKNKEIMVEKAIDVINDKERLKKSAIHANAYKIVNKQIDLDNAFDVAEHRDIEGKTATRLRRLPLKK